MSLKDKLVFALYVTTSVAVVTHAGVEIWKTFKKPDHVCLYEADPETLKKL